MRVLGAIVATLAALEVVLDVVPQLGWLTALSFVFFVVIAFILVVPPEPLRRSRRAMFATVTVLGIAASMLSVTAIIQRVRDHTPTATHS